MPPILSQTGVALNKGLAGISAISFDGIVFGGTIKTGGQLADEAGFDSIFGGGEKATGARDTDAFAS